MAEACALLTHQGSSNTGRKPALDQSRSRLNQSLAELT